MIGLTRSRLTRWAVASAFGVTGGTFIMFIRSPNSSPPPPKSSTAVAKDIGEVSGAGILGGVTATKLASFALCGVGFTEAGIAAKSFASSYMSAVGAIKAGSWYSAFQSIGAKGGFVFFGPVGVGAAVVCGSVYAYYKIRQMEKEELERLRRQEEERRQQLWYNKYNPLKWK